MTDCPSCGAGVATESVEPGEILTCGDCGTELEVLSVTPLSVALAPETKEDWGE